MDIRLPESRVIGPARCVYLWGEILFNSYISSNSVWILRAPRDMSSELNVMWCHIECIFFGTIETINSSSSDRARSTYLQQTNEMPKSRQPAQSEAQHARTHIITSLKINFIWFIFRFFVLLFIFTVIFAFVYVSSYYYTVRHRTSGHRIAAHQPSIYLSVICDFCVEWKENTFGW